jgi:hypothetical protein
MNGKREGRIRVSGAFASYSGRFGFVSQRGYVGRYVFCGHRQSLQANVKVVPQAASFHILSNSLFTGPNKPAVRR